ncbi:MAG TPA: hypothetical protein PLX89_13500 [Verrucomicrobiota bacterium]|nr:hypothetical protein [Verrucomicrobiota bacterium]
MDLLTEPADKPSAPTLTEEVDSNGVVARGRQCFVRLDRATARRGDFAIVPYRKVRGFEELTDDESLEILHLARRSVSIWRATLGRSDLKVRLMINDEPSLSGGDCLGVCLTLESVDNNSPLSPDGASVLAEAFDCVKIGAEFSRRFIEAELPPS